MATLSEEQILENAAKDGSMDVTEWPRVLEKLLQRLHDIVHNEFPIPPPPPPPPPAPALQAQLDPEVVVASTPPRLQSSDTGLTESSLADTERQDPSDSQDSMKENDAPVDIAARRPLHPRVDESQRTEEMPPPQLPDAGLPLPIGLPPDLSSMYQSSTRILQYDFAESPPYTIQRLAELVLRPKRHYRFLPAFLRALDRIVSVSSPVTDFPLLVLRAPSNGGFLTNGNAQVNGISEKEGLGSDESLGGALLTPIPWLRNQTGVLTPATSSEGGSQGELHSESTETIEGPHGAGSIETVSVTVNGIHSTSAASSQPSSSPIASPTLSEQSDASTGSASSTEASLREQGGVTQGELLRQEQEAGVVPVNPAGQPMTPRRTLHQGGAGAVGRDPISGGISGISDTAMDEVSEEQPHARGPEEIGMEDMGPQPQKPEDGQPVALDMEAAVGRGRSKSPQPPPSGEHAAFPEAERMEDVESAGEAEKPSQDPKDVEKEVEKLKEALDEQKKDEAKDADGDVIVADVDGKPVESEASEEAPGDGKPDAVDSTAH